MAGNITSRSDGSLFQRRGRVGRGGRNRHLGHHLVEQHRARLRLLLASFAVAVRMFGMAGLADYLRDFAVNHAGDGMVQKKAAARAVIID